MLPRSGPASLAALAVGPICGLLVVTSVFRPTAPNGNLRWGFWALTAIFALASLGFLRARTMRQVALRGATFGLFFAVVGCAFVWWSEPASRLDGVRVYGIGGYAFTGACIVLCTTASIVAVAWPILRASNERAHDHGEGFVTAFATLAIPFAGFVMMDRSIGARRVDAALGALALPCLALVIFQDSNSFRWGGEYTFKIWGYPMDLRTGMSFETSAIPREYLSLLTIDMDKITLGVGGGLHIGEHWRFDMTYAHLFASSVDVPAAEAKIPRVNPIAGNAPFVAASAIADRIVSPYAL